MIWQIILLIIIFLLIIPIPIKIKLSFNVLRLSGEVVIRVLKIFNYKVRVRFRGAYVFITTAKGTRREKLTSKNFNLAFAIQLIRQIYFRLILVSLHFVSEEGYYNDAMITAVGCGVVDILTKCASTKIAHNKKSAHIFVKNDAKYNQDCLNWKLDCQIKICVFDIIYSLINSWWSLKGEQYERSKTEYQQDQGIN